tara:strand:- start:320 stop:928 length:609 start_codon:yes stop_codon:yes gene_type:complete
MTTIKRITALLSSIVFIGLLSGTAYAGPINGSLEYNGIFIPSDAPGSTVSLATATYLDFLSPSTFAIGEGDMLGLTGIGTLDLFDFYITPFSGTTVSPVLVWSDAGASDLSFSLTSLVIIDQSTNSTGDTLVLNGRGIFTQSGFDTTDAVWSLTAQDTGAASPVLTFSASTTVSEPSMLTLLGLTLLGMGWTRRVKRRRLAA